MAKGPQALPLPGWASASPAVPASPPIYRPIDAEEPDMASKAVVCLKIAERSAQQTRALAGALDNARVVTAALEQRIQDLEADVEQRVRAEREAREEAQEARRFAQRAEDLLANAKQELQKQR